MGIRFFLNKQFLGVLVGIFIGMLIAIFILPSDVARYNRLRESNPALHRDAHRFNVQNEICKGSKFLANKKLTIKMLRFLH